MSHARPSLARWYVLLVLAWAAAIVVASISLGSWRATILVVMVFVDTRSLIGLPLLALLLAPLFAFPFAVRRTSFVTE